MYIKARLHPKRPEWCARSRQRCCFSRIRKTNHLHVFWGVFFPTTLVWLWCLFNVWRFIQYPAKPPHHHQSTEGFADLLHFALCFLSGGNYHQGTTISQCSMHTNCWRLVEEQNRAHLTKGGHFSYIFIQDCFTTVLDKVGNKQDPIKKTFYEGKLAEMNINSVFLDHSLPFPSETIGNW